MFVTGGIVAQLVSVAAMREAQKRASWTIWAISLALFAASVWSMSVGLGAEMGVTWALTTISIAAWLLILSPFFRAKTIGHDRVPRTQRRAPVAPSGSKWRLTVKLIAAGPLWLLAALGLSLLIATKPWTSELTRLFVGGLSTPLWWSIGALHSTVDLNLWRVVLLPIALSLLTLGAFYLT
ncbi:MAG: hypothetical protein AAF291_12855 [Pseudomonadota bacterium]